jgi:hypothetical protein
MALIKVRNAADTAWITVGGGVEILQQDAEPGTTYPGQLWLDTDAADSVGAIVLIETQVASSDASLDFDTGFSGYSKIWVMFENVIPATDAVHLRMRVSTDGGSSYLSTNIYTNACYTSADVSSGANVGQNSQAQFEVCEYSGTGSAANEYGISGELKIYGFNSAAAYKQSNGQIWHAGSSGHWRIFNMGGEIETTTALNAVQFYFSSGNIESGKISIYGIKD